MARRGAALSLGDHSGPCVKNVNIWVRVERRVKVEEIRVRMREE